MLRASRPTKRHKPSRRGERIASLNLLLLPDELLLSVLSLLGDLDVGRVACVCRRLCLLAGDDAVWIERVARLPALPVQQLRKPTWQSWRERWLSMRLPAAHSTEVPPSWPMYGIANYRAFDGGVLIEDKRAQGDEKQVAKHEMTGPNEWRRTCCVRLPANSWFFGYFETPADRLLVVRRIAADDVLVLDRSLELVAWVDTGLSRLVTFVPWADGRLLACSDDNAALLWLALSAQLSPFTPWSVAFTPANARLPAPANKGPRQPSLVSVSPTQAAFLCDRVPWSTLHGRPIDVLKFRQREQRFFELHRLGPDLNADVRRFEPVTLESMCVESSVKIVPVAGHVLLMTLHTERRKTLHTEDEYIIRGYQLYSVDFDYTASQTLDGYGYRSPVTATSDDVLCVALYEHQAPHCVRIDRFNCAARLLSTTRLDPATRRPLAEPNLRLTLLLLADGRLLLERHTIMGIFVGDEVEVKQEILSYR